nr:DUF3800 domain-containing protein [Corynebacterium cyclohexanicum]
MGPLLLAFIDESARGQQYYYMGALIVGTSEALAIERSFNKIGDLAAKQVRGLHPTTEFHAYELFHGEGAWERVPVSLRVRLSRLLVKSIEDSGAKFIFRGIDIHAVRRKYVRPHEPHDLALCHALESVQRVITSDFTPSEHALVLADEHHSAPDSRSRFRSMKIDALSGFTNVQLSNLLDTIYFGPSDHSRLLQAADIATFFTNRYLTVTENHKNAVKVMAEIEKRLKSVTRYRYIWAPT